MQKIIQNFSKEAQEVINLLELKYPDEPVQCICRHETLCSFLYFHRDYTECAGCGKRVSKHEENKYRKKLTKFENIIAAICNTYNGGHEWKTGPFSMRTCKKCYATFRTDWEKNGDKYLAKLESLIKKQTEAHRYIIAQNENKIKKLQNIMKGHKK